MYKFNVLAGPGGHIASIMNIQTCGMSLRGQEKPENEDLVYHRTSQIPGGEAMALLVVCDGMSGYPMGSFASELTTHLVTSELDKLFPHTDYLHAHLEQPTIPGDKRLRAWLQKIIQAANHLIFEYGQERPEHTHAGTRMTLAFIQGMTAHIAHIGDTRAYSWRTRRLTQITEDHTFAAELEKNGVLESVNLARHPFRKIMSRTIGTQPEVTPALYTLSLCPGDKLMLCSDGLWAAFDDVQWMAAILENNLPPMDLCLMLLAEARHPNNYDDMSVVLACLGPLLN